MSRRIPRLLAVLSVAAAVLTLPSGAAAHHVVPTASIDATLGPKTKSGMRVLTVRWDTSCGVADAEVVVNIARVITPKNPASKPVVLDAATAGEQGPGSAQIDVSPGSRFKPIIEVECTALDSSGDAHTATAGAMGPEFVIAPRLTGYRFTYGTICGVEPSARAMRSLQVGQNHAIEPAALYNGVAMLRRPNSTKGITLRLRGGGLDLRVKGRTSRGVFTFILPKPRRAGKAKVWLVFDGTPTNKLTIRVLPRRC